MKCDKSSTLLSLLGNFSGPKNQEIVAARGSAIELLRPDDTGKVVSICFTPLFSIVRSLLPFRLAGEYNLQFKNSLNEALASYSSGR